MLTSTRASVSLIIQAAPNGDVQKVLVAGHPVQSWKEAVEATVHFVAMADNGTPEDPEDIENTEEALGSRIMKCIGCGGPVDVDSDFQCNKCGKEYISCPGCDQPYPMMDNEDDHCPLCGYSSWGELDEDTADKYQDFLIKAVKKAAKTRKLENFTFNGFKFTVEVVDQNGVPTIQFCSENDADDHPLAEWMQNPEVVLNADADSHFWKASNELMTPMQAWEGPLPEGWKKKSAPAGQESAQGQEQQQD